VYVLQSLKDSKLYTGFTDNLQKRILKHSFGKVFSTKSRRLLKLIYLEICTNKKDAKQREKYLKTGTGKNFIKARLKHYFKGRLA